MVTQYQVTKALTLLLVDIHSASYFSVVLTSAEASTPEEEPWGLIGLG